MAYGMNDRIVAFLVVVFFHYICYLIFIVLEHIQYPKKVHTTYGICKPSEFKLFSEHLADTTIIISRSSIEGT